MAKFQFRLESLLKLREASRQQRRLELAEAFHAERILTDQAGQLAQDIREVMLRSRVSVSPGYVDVDQLRDTHRYRLVLESQQAVMEQRMKQLTQEVQKRRDALAAADKEVRVLEKLRERQLSEHAAAELHREFMELDEVAVQQWNQKARVGE
ncbi:MAG: flagellar export protein FliJ [Planctomycetaceae bacterium]|nr:flagellar export protein FliJ [Planctomycetaceae bacterium]